MKNLVFYVDEKKYTTKSGGTYSVLKVNGNHIATFLKAKDRIDINLYFN